MPPILANRPALGVTEWIASNRLRENSATRKSNACESRSTEIFLTIGAAITSTFGLSLREVLFSNIEYKTHLVIPAQGVDLFCQESHDSKGTRNDDADPFPRGSFRHRARRENIGSG